jgi:hypothetical protein
LRERQWLTIERLHGLAEAECEEDRESGESSGDASCLQGGAVKGERAAGLRRERRARTRGERKIERRGTGSSQES